MARIQLAKKVGSFSFNARTTNISASRAKIFFPSIRWKRTARDAQPLILALSSKVRAFSINGPICNTAFLPEQLSINPIKLW